MLIRFIAAVSIAGTLVLGPAAANAERPDNSDQTTSTVADGHKPRFRGGGSSVRPLGRYWS